MLRSAHILIGCVLALLGMGVVMVRSAAMDVTQPDPAATSAWAILTSMVDRNLIYAGLAVAAMFIASRLPISKLGRVRWWCNPVLLALVLAVLLCGFTFMPGIAHTVNGAARWLKVGVGGAAITFQPSELMKWTLVAALAWWCSQRGQAIRKFWLGLLPGLLLIGVACGLVIIEDLGTAVLMGAVAVGVLIAGGAKLWQIGLLLPLGVGAAIAAIATSPYRVRRLTAFLDPWSDLAGTGYHPVQSMLAFAEGGVAGEGLGNAIQKYYIPEDTTDFLFPIIAEELGFFGAALVVGLFLTILWTGLGVIQRCEHPFGRLLGLGVLLTLGLQASINIAVVTVVVPTKGIALPFVSAGGTGWIVSAFAVGLLAAMDREQTAEEILQADRINHRESRMGEATMAVG
jgi:cell division protein FtsW